MDTITIDHDILLAYVQAFSFPEGVMAAHEQLHVHFPFPGDGRKFFGLSRPEDASAISYKAAAEIRSEQERHAKGLPVLMLKSGNYYSITIRDYMQQIPAIGNTFQQLLSQSGIDPEGYCVELYLNEKDVQCMVRMAG